MYFFQMDQHIREAELIEDFHTRRRYLSWLAKVDDKWERKTAVLRSGESHPVLETQNSRQENSNPT
jgi:hypothetical protein